MPLVAPLALVFRVWMVVLVAMQLQLCVGCGGGGGGGSVGAWEKAAGSRLGARDEVGFGFAANREGVLRRLGEVGGRRRARVHRRRLLQRLYATCLTEAHEPCAACVTVAVRGNAALPLGAVGGDRHYLRVRDASAACAGYDAGELANCSVPLATESLFQNYGTSWREGEVVLDIGEPRVVAKVCRHGMAVPSARAEAVRWAQWLPAAGEAWSRPVWQGPA